VNTNPLIFCVLTLIIVGEFFYILFNAIFSKRTLPSHGSDGYYFLENGEYSQKQIVKAVGAALYEFEEINSEEPVPLTKEEIEKFPQVVNPPSCAFAALMYFRSSFWAQMLGPEDTVHVC
jgi:hypothetical protein